VEVAIFGLLGVVLGGAITYWSQHAADKRREKHEALQAIAEMYDAAIAAVATLEAARWGPGLHSEAVMTLPAVTPEQKEALMKELDTEATRRLVAAKDAVRAALAALYPYSPDLKRYWDKNEPVEESEADAVLTLLAKRRQELFGSGSAYVLGPNPN
jgi:hypothetical protein